MGENNIVDARDRFASRKAPVAPRALEALGRLQTTTRTDEADRVVLAKKLGQAANRLDPSAPKKGAHAIMRDAWGEDSSKKTGRLFVFDGKEAPALLESSGANWARLVEAAARLIVAKGNHHPSQVDNEIRQQIRRLLRGTSFLPASPQTDMQGGAVGELLQRLADKFIHRLQTSTRLFELWRVLEQHPFAVSHLEGDKAPPHSVVPQASRLAGQISWSMCWDADWRHYFVPMALDDRFSSTSWAGIFLPIGGFVREVNVRTFVPPKHVADAFLDRSLEADKAWNLFNEWHTGTSDGMYFALPEHDYNKRRGHGARYEKFMAAYLVFIKINPSYGGCSPIVEFQVHGDFLKCTAIPPLCDNSMISNFITNVHSEEFTFKYDPFIDTRAALLVSNRYKNMVDKEYISCSPVRIMNIDYGDQDEFTLEYAQNFGDFINFSINDDIDDARNLLYGGGDMKFIPTFPVDSEVTPPAKPQSLAEALLRNAALPFEDQLISMVEHAGRNIAEAGLGYHYARVKYYQDIIDRL